jgi:uncharacterized cupredoxin-like copper-binding protein
VTEDVTRVPTMSDAAAQATREAASAPAATPGAEGGTPTTNTTTTTAVTFAVVAQDIFFEPKEVTIPADTDVTVNLPNEGAAPHNFSIDALGIDVDIAPGATEQVVINAPAGEYEFYCNVPGHKEAGMVGTLIVSEDAAAAPAGAATPAAAPAEAPPGTPAAQEVAATPLAPVAAASPANVESAASQTFDMVAYDIYFEPKEVTIPANTDVTFMIANEGVAPHNFSIDELGIDIDLPVGATEEVVINAPAGEYEYYCNVPGHKEAGMVGTLIVTDDAAAGVAPAQAAVEPATPAVTAATPAAGGEEQAGGAEAMEVVSHDIFFEPDTLSIPADTDVTVRLPNEGVTPHNFSIDELGISVDIAPGATEETVINAPAGEYEYYCNVPGHKQAGMVGTLTVG